MTDLKNHQSELQLTTSEQTLVSTNSSQAKFLGKFTITNTSANDVQVTLWRIASSGTGTTGSGGNWIWRRTVLAGETVTVDKLQGHVVGPSMKVSGLADTDSVINVDISGTTES